MRLMSVVVPVYRNEASIPELVASLSDIAAEASVKYGCDLEAVFVVDGSPDASHDVLRGALAASGLRSQLILHSRNFGSFAAIRTGLTAGRGDCFSVIAADLQEPPELILDFLAALRDGGHDVAVGRRVHRSDKASSRLAASIFWRLYRRLVNREIPPGGVDVFACTRRFRDELLALREANSSLVALIFWLGYSRVEVPYQRRPRPYGKSAWTFRRKLAYLMDSIFSFTDLPITALMWVGATGALAAAGLSVVTIFAKFVGGIDVPGYAAQILAIAFFGALNLLGMGLVGVYAWRAFENTKGRPGALVSSSDIFPVRAGETRSWDAQERAKDDLLTVIAEPQRVDIT